MIYSRQHKALVVPYSGELAALIPKAKSLFFDGEKKLVLPHTDDAVRVLKNVGYRPPPPILLHYDWNRSKPFDAQRDTAAMLSTRSRAYVLSDMGTGKTRAALFAADWLMKDRTIKAALIVAPLSTLTVTWAREIIRVFPHRRAVVLHGSRAKRLAMLNQPADFYIINHDGVRVIEKEIVKRRDIDLVILDELAVYRTYKTTRWLSALEIVRNRKYVWGMTGSPTPNEPLDAWAQCRLITPERVPHYQKQFKNEVMVQVSQFKWLARPTANTIVRKAMSPSVRFKRSDCMDLPPVVHMTHEATMSTKQKHIYDALMKKFRAEFAEGTITPANEGVRVSKLLQVCSGFAYTDKTGAVRLDPKDRLQLLSDIVTQTEAKVLVFCPFIELVDMVAEHLRKRWTVECVTGQTSTRERDRIFTEFQASPLGAKGIVAHPQTMSHGLTLTEANTIIWFSPHHSAEIYEQANARISRPGQTRSQFIVHIESSPIERRVYKRLEKRLSTQGLLLDMFNGVEEED